VSAADRLTLTTLLIVGALVLCAPGLLTGQVVHSVDQREACLTCHDLDGAFEARVLHAPVEEAQCSACHSPHASRFGSLLRERTVLLCSRCHGEMAAKTDRAQVHAPVADGACTECHAPHASEHAGLLREEGVALCSSCHGEIAEWLGRKTQHSPFRRGQCARCHDPHASDFPALAVDTQAAICGNCHPPSAKFRSDHGGFPVDQAECQQCHDPHASDRLGLFKPNLHAPFEDGDCSVCHSGASGAEPFQLVGSQAELCGDCHDEQVERSRAAPFPHISAGGGGCTACHNPHAGEGAALLQGSGTGVCLSCHDPGGAESGLEGRFSSHESLECAQCHDPHGGDRPLLLATDPIQLCNECHGHQHNISHPMGDEIRDPRGGRPLDCLSCHGIHHSTPAKYLHNDGKGELCVGCHKEINF